MQTVIVTGAAGFIGSAVCRYLRGNNLAHVIGVDKMTYAVSREALDSLKDDPDFRLIKTDICNGSSIMEILLSAQPDGIMHLAAETHVDRSIT
jgi:dTDP-glucose 4,6-dehydratase